MGGDLACRRSLLSEGAGLVKRVVGAWIAGVCAAPPGLSAPVSARHVLSAHTRFLSSLRPPSHHHLVTPGVGSACCGFEDVFLMVG